MSTAKVQPWFKRYPPIFEEEKAALEARGFALDAAKFANGEVVFHGFSNADPQRKLVVVFPPGYPSFHPSVMDTAESKLLPRHHQPQSRDFCVFGPGGIEWSSKSTAVEALDEVEALITKYPPGSNSSVDGEYPEPVSALLPTEPAGAFLVPPAIVDLVKNAPVGTLRGNCDIHVLLDNPIRGVIARAFLGDRSVTSDYCKLKRKPLRIEQALLVVSHKPLPIFTREEGFDPWLEAAGDIKKKKGDRWKWFVFVYPEESGTSAGMRLAWTVIYHDAVKRIVYRTHVLRPAETFARIPGCEPLATKHVCILGLGALGSRIAVALAASGVRRYCLVDGDIMEPHNAVRHECGVGEFGTPKIHAVWNRMSNINPECKEPLLLLGRVGLMRPKLEADLIAQMGQTDLIINATASEQASHWIDEMAHDLKKPRMHATVTSGAWGGEVIRVIPGKSPCWRCHQEANLIPSHERRAQGLLFAPGCAQPTFTGSLPEVSIVADLAASMAIETLLGRPTHDFDGSYIRWQGRDPGTGKASPQVTVASPAARTHCPLCSPA